MKNLQSKFVLIFVIFSFPLFMPSFGTLPEFGKGVGMPAQLLHCEDIWNLNVGVFYTWDYVKPECNYNFIPTVYSKSFTGTLEITNLKVLLFMNEPNAYSQANTSPEEAAIKFQQLDLYNWFVIGGNLLPKEFNPSDATMSEYEWLDRFIMACPGCIDGLGIHYYDWHGCEPESFTGYLDAFKSYNLPIYVTELGCIDPNNILGNVQLWGICFEKTFGCFPFATRVPENLPEFESIELIDESGKLTRLGEIYNALDPGNKCWCSFLPAILKDR